MFVELCDTLWMSGMTVLDNKLSSSLFLIGAGCYFDICENVTIIGPTAVVGNSILMNGQSSRTLRAAGLRFYDCRYIAILGSLVISHNSVECYGRVSVHSSGVYASYFKSFLISGRSVVENNTITNVRGIGAGIFTIPATSTALDTFE